jgi:hypothetical protein
MRLLKDLIILKLKRPSVETDFEIYVGAKKAASAETNAARFYD